MNCSTSKSLELSKSTEKWHFVVGVFYLQISPTLLTSTPALFPLPPLPMPSLLSEKSLSKSSSCFFLLRFGAVARFAGLDLRFEDIVVYTDLACNMADCHFWHMLTEMVTVNWEFSHEDIRENSFVYTRQNAIIKDRIYFIVQSRYSSE